jgi:hypothetical protein
MSTDRQPLTTAQQERLATLTEDWMRYIIDRDEPHDTHVFASLYDERGQLVAEHVIDADGRCCDGDC